MLDRLDRPYGAISSAPAGARSRRRRGAQTHRRHYRAPPQKETGTTMADAVDATTMNNTATMAR